MPFAPLRTVSKDLGASKRIQNMNPAVSIVRVYFNSTAAVGYVDDAVNVDFGQRQKFVAVFAYGTDFTNISLRSAKRRFVQFDLCNHFNQFIELLAVCSLTCSSPWVTMVILGQGFVFGRRNSANESIL